MSEINHIISTGDYLLCIKSMHKQSAALWHKSFIGTYQRFSLEKKKSDPRTKYKGYKNNCP